MAESVDTMIDNAYTRAVAWGTWAEGLSAQAVGGVDPFRDPPKADVKQPALVSSRRGMPRLQGTPEVGNKPAHDLEKQLDEFFESLFPPSDGAFSWAAGWVVKTLGGDVQAATACGNSRVPPKIEGGRYGTTMPGEFDDAYGQIWKNARVNVTAFSDMSALQRPANALVRSQNVDSILYRAEQDTMTKLRAALWKAAAGMKVVDLRRQAIAAVGEYIKAKAQIAMADKQMEMAIERALIQVDRSLTAWYASSVDASAVALSMHVSRAQEWISTGTTVSEAMEKKIQNTVSAGIAGADTMAAVAQAANASLNSVVSSSTVGFG